MNLKEIEYIVKIEEKKGIIGAAEDLYLTPSALNQQLLRLEKELGTPLFIRTRGNSGWTPTPEGQLYLTTAKEMLRLKQETYHKILDMANIKKGSLSIGFPPERGSLMFTKVYPLFHRKYPDIVVNSIEASVRRQQQLIRQGELDVGFMTLRKKQRTDDCYETICQEELILAAPLQLELPGCDPKTEITLERIKEVPFALMYRESTVFECVEEIFRQYNFHPEIIFEATRAETILDMVEAGLCCGIVPAYEMNLKKRNVNYFYLPKRPSWQIEASWRKNTYVSQPAKEFLKLAGEYWKSIE